MAPNSDQNINFQIFRFSSDGGREKTQKSLKLLIKRVGEKSFQDHATSMEVYESSIYGGIEKYLQTFTALNFCS